MFDNRLAALSSQIEQMTPQQRQQFAMLHRDDPIAVSMAKFVNDQDSALRNAIKVKQAPQAMNQPKVVDQVIQSMAPPAGGLHALPAPSLAQMPDGGITGENSPPQQPQPGYASGGTVSDDDLGAVPNFYDTGPPNKQPFFSMELLRRAMRERNMQDLAGSGAVLTPRQMMPSGPSPDIPPPTSQLPAAPVDVVPNATPDQSAGLPALAAAQQQPPSPQSDGGGGAPAVPSMASVQGPGAAGGIASGMTAPGDVDPMEVLRKYQNDGGPLTDPLSAQRDQLTARKVQDAQDAADQLKQDQDSLGVAGLDREARLNKRQDKLDDMEAKSPGMALLEAGLSMMASKSPYALQGIGEGALAGTKAYREGQKAINEGREKLDDAFGRLEEMRRGEQVSNMKDLRAAKANINSAMTDGVSRTLDGLQLAYGYKREDAKAGLQAVMEDLKSKRGLYGEVYRADTAASASNYAANQQLRGHMAMAGAEVQAAKERNSGANKQMALSLQANKMVNDYITKARTAAAQTMKPFGAVEMETARQQALASMSPDLRQYVGIAEQPLAARQYDTSQIRSVD